MEVKTMNYDLIAAEIIAAIGGKQNIEGVTHCATRLRFNLKDDSEIDTENVKRIEGVVGVSNTGGQFQIIIGTEVQKVYNEIAAIIQTKVSTSTKNSNKGVINNVLDTISGIFVMIIPVLIAGGIISAILAILTTAGWVSTEDETYVVISSIQQAIFYFLPLFVGYSAGVKFKASPFLGMALGAVLCFSAINGVEGLSVFGIKIQPISYNSTVFPVILGVWLMSYVERGLNKITPNMIKIIIVPMLTLFVGVIATLTVLGPLGATLGDILATIITSISNYASWLAPAIIALIYPIMILTGMHHSLIPLVITSLTTSGFDPLLMVAGFISNISQGGAALATGVLEKDSNKKSVAFTTGFTALCGVSEPALFGITLANKKTLISVCVGGGVGALFGGIMSMKAYGFVGGLPSLPLFMDPSGSYFNLFVTLIAVVISFVVTFGLTYILNLNNAKLKDVNHDVTVS